MKYVLLLSGCLGALLLFGACSGAGAPAGTPTRSASPITGAPTTVTSAPPNPAAAASAAAGSPVPPPVGGASKLTVTGGPIGGTASATMRTTPGSSCGIVYIHPSGKKSTLRSLVTKTAAADGTVSWTWSIDPGTKPPGQGSVTVTCGSDQATVPITIAPAP